MCQVTATLAHLPSSPSSCPWACRAQPSNSGKHWLFSFKTHVSDPVESVFCVSCLFFSSEVGSGQPFRESDLESFFVYTLASFYWKQINCSQKATQMEEKWRSGKEFGLVNFSIIEIKLIISSNSFWLIWSIYSDAPLKIVQWIFTFDFRIWCIISIFNYCYELVAIASLPLLLTFSCLLWCQKLRQE